MLIKLGVGSVGALIVVAAGGAYGLLARANAAAGRAFLSAQEVRVLEALGDAQFPPGNALGVAARDLDLVSPVDTWLASMPATEQQSVAALIALLELWPRLTLQGIARFSQLSLDDRVEILRGFDASSLELRRALGQLYRVLPSFPYFEEPAVLAGMGLQFGCQVPIE